MARRIESGGGTYLYAVIGGAKELAFGPVGLYDSEVFTIPAEGIAAVVSDLPTKDKLRPERRHLAAHQGVLSKLVEEGHAVLPVSFGTIADGNDAIHRMLSRYLKDLQEQVRRVEGKVEMEVRVTWDVSNVFEYFVNTNSDLKAARDRVFDGQHEPTRDEKIELGQTFESILNAERETHTGTVEQILSACCREVKKSKCRNESEVMRLSCLLDEEAQSRFGAAINEAAERFDDNYAIETSGPFPPYNFVEMRIKI